MKSMLVLLLAACAAASYVAPVHHPHVGGPVVVRAPSHDSAIIQSHRLGGNFAYSTHEAHAHAVINPIVAHRQVPVGVSFHPGQPIVHSETDYVSTYVPRYGYAQPLVARSHY
ncbi:uncharacterized protein LOC125043340 [Penaeus chinensis]|uniref:uncharacterized protein LOC125043340 n=1 Tax=Penaeus chinensis TaxID=139456 RepID=UPI001FB584B0|nr:uncharacterized protein LOC125043340 [Penaeus chinensis]